MSYTLEVCVDSTASALAAKKGGADRLELCADLIVGGTTPSLALVRQVKETTGLPVRALLRPRFGDFCYDHWELEQMAESAAALVEAGADGIVTGVLTPDGALDVDALRPIYAAAKSAADAAGRPVALTLHRAFDVCRDPYAALEAACFSDPWPESILQKELDNPLSLWLCAMDGDTIAGYVGSQTVLGEADMMNLAVSPAYRRAT